MDWLKPFRKLRLWILKLFGADHQKLNEFLASWEAQRVLSIVDEVCQKIPKALSDDERPILEGVYHRAQASGITLNGYVLRFVIEYALGKRQGRWD